MIKFNPDKKPLKDLTHGECLEPAMKIRDKKEATAYFNEYCEYLFFTKQVTDIFNAAEVARKNLGYYAGYFSHEVRGIIEDLFECEHPVFGPSKEMGFPTAQEAMQCGMQRKTLKELRNGTKRN